MKLICFLRKRWKVLLISLSVVALGAVTVISCIDRPIINHYEKNSGDIQTHTYIHEDIDSSIVKR